MKQLLALPLLCLSLSASAQTTVTLTEDLILTETLVVSENTRYEGNGFRIVCDGCNPAILVRTGVVAHFQSVRFKKGYAKWLRVEGGNDGRVTWDGPGMRGHIFVNSN